MPSSSISAIKAWRQYCAGRHPSGSGTPAIQDITLMLGTKIARRRLLNKLCHPPRNADDCQNVYAKSGTNSSAFDTVTSRRIGITRICRFAILPSPLTSRHNGVTCRTRRMFGGHAPAGSVHATRSDPNQIGHNRHCNENIRSLPRLTVAFRPRNRSSSNTDSSGPSIHRASGRA
jgi:hypothetical protein